MPIAPAAATAAVDGEAPVSTPNQIAGVDVTILPTWSRIRRERGRQAWQMQQLERLNVAIEMLRGVQGALRTAAGGGETAATTTGTSGEWAPPALEVGLRI